MMADDVIVFACRSDASMDPQTDVFNFMWHVCTPAVISVLVIHGTKSRRRILILRTRCINVKCFWPKHKHDIHGD